MSKKHTIRNGIAVSVAGGLILAAVRSSSFRGILSASFHWLLSVIRLMGSLLVHQIKTPVWILAILATLAIFSVFRIMRALRKRDSDSSWYTYVQDDLFGVVWRWRYSSRRIDNLWAFCPRCDLELVFHEQRTDYNEPSYLYPPEFTQFVCENCHIKSQKLQGGKS
ncbi:MAG: hypothetical protein ACYTEX_08985, partial [Planctomycetota bacterium]